MIYRDMKFLLLSIPNQEYDWFLDIAFVRSVSMYVLRCTHVFMHVLVCLPQITIYMKRNPISQLNNTKTY